MPSATASKFSQDLFNGLFFSCLQMITLALVSGIITISISEPFAKNCFLASSLMALFVVLFKVHAVETGYCKSLDELLRNYNYLSCIASFLCVIGLFSKCTTIIINDKIVGFSGQYFQFLFFTISFDELPLDMTLFILVVQIITHYVNTIECNAFVETHDE